MERPELSPGRMDMFLRDYVTGAVVNLRRQSVYAFSSGATGWTERFQLVVAPAGVAVQPDVVDRAGWRLLSAPVAGATVTTLAGLNLV